VITAIRAALALIPRELLALALTAVLAWGLVTGHRLALTQRDLAKSEATLSNEREKHAKALAAATTKTLAAERGLQAAIDAAREIEDAWNQKARAADARAAADVDRLRNAVAIAANTIRATGARAADPAVAAGSETAARAAELLGACATRYRELAADAHGADSAGRACEARYDAAREALKQSK